MPSYCNHLIIVHQITLLLKLAPMFYQLAHMFYQLAPMFYQLAYCLRDLETCKQPIRLLDSYMLYSNMKYRSVWWRLFHAPNSLEWFNVLSLVNLLFSLPVSNGKLERTFSQVNLLKSNKRNLLGTDTLSDLLVLNTNKLELEQFLADSAIELWWDAKTRRPSQAGPRKEYKKRSCRHVAENPSLDSDAMEEEGQMILEDWDEWLQVDSD